MPPLTCRAAAARQLERSVPQQRVAAYGRLDRARRGVEDALVNRLTPKTTEQLQQARRRATAPPATSRAIAPFGLAAILSARGPTFASEPDGENRHFGAVLRHLSAQSSGTRRVLFEIFGDFATGVVLGRLGE